MDVLRLIHLQEEREIMSRKFGAFAVASLFVVAVFCSSVAAQSVEDQIKKIETDRAAAVVKGDMALLDRETSDDYTLINANGQMSDKAQMISAFKSGQSKLTVDDLSDMKVRVYGDTAVVTGKANVKGMMGGKDATGQAIYTRVYVKKGGHWLAVALQQTRIATP
jgi:ketosteroid isomerase-like protein